MRTFIFLVLWRVVVIAEPQHDSGKELHLKQVIAGYNPSHGTGRIYNRQQYFKSSNLASPQNCLPKCQNSGICVAPNRCRCTKQYFGSQCQFEKKPCDAKPHVPQNSQMDCKSRGCSIDCMQGHQFPGGLTSTNIVCKGGTWVPRKREWKNVPDCEPICDQGCQNGGNCVSVNVCQCLKNFRGHQCQYNIDRCTIKKLGFNGAVRCKGDWETLSCTISCPEGIQMTQPPAAVYTCSYESGRFAPNLVPQCKYKKIVTNFSPRFDFN